MAMRRNLEGRLREAQGKYRRLDRRGEGRMLDYWRKVTGYSRRHLMRKLGNVLPEKSAGVRTRRRSIRRRRSASGKRCGNTWVVRGRSVSWRSCRNGPGIHRIMSRDLDPKMSSGLRGRSAEGVPIIWTGSKPLSDPAFRPRLPGHGHARAIPLPCQKRRGL